MIGRIIIIKSVSIMSDEENSPVKQVKEGVNAVLDALEEQL